ncbi:helix-turn-helix domain-containing protein [Beijerinckia sp. L45]|uniref:winged helix-turn-helix transcriptional regulator n=1 Tax=Beijerinckia sp. L45 TaxID=1641855 RepID=UPI00131B5B6F|nr:helix-turn-helix domain-containing protein [Beijerinckia sp. L45]
MRRTDLGGANCPIARSLDEIGDWWTLMIVRDAFRGARRFSEFQRGLGLAKNILSVRLRKMLDDGILELVPAAGGGAHREYQLTDKGLRLRVILVAIRQWGEDHLFEAGEPMMVMVGKEDGQPIGRLRLTSKDGRSIDPWDIDVKDGVRGTEDVG